MIAFDFGGAVSQVCTLLTDSRRKVDVLDHSNGQLKIDLHIFSESSVGARHEEVRYGKCTSCARVSN